MTSSPSCHRRWLALAVAASALIVGALAAREARAYAVDGKVGVGFEETLLALGDGTFTLDAVPDIRASGLGVWGWIGDVGWEAIIGARAVTVPAAPTEFMAFLTLGGHYNMFRSPRVNLSVGLRMTTGLARTRALDTGEADPVRVGLAGEAPLRAIYFLSDQFSISGSVGPVLAWNGVQANPLTGGRNSMTFSLFRGGYSGGIGFCVWFR